MSGIEPTSKSTQLPVGVGNDVNIQVGDVDVSPTNPVPVDDVWTFEEVIENTPDDIDKTFTVPAGEVWQILSVGVLYTSTATVGNRTLMFYVYNASGDDLFFTAAGANQAESTIYNYSFAPGVSDQTTIRRNTLTTPIPPTLFLTEGDVLNIYEITGTDANDDMVIAFRYAKKAL